MTETNRRRRAVAALLLVAPVPSVGVLAAMVVAPGTVGRLVFTACKLWLVVLPAIWWLGVEGGRPSWSPTRRGGLATGALLGAAMAAVIVAVFLVGGRDLLDAGPLRDEVTAMGLGRPAAYLGAAAYWIFVNSVIEEYVYRWFVFRQCEALMPGSAAVAASAAVFTAHHVIALSEYLPLGLTALASAGILVAGAAWSWCYLRYRSIWPGWLSHAIADVAIFAIGWRLVFGGPP